MFEQSIVFHNAAIKNIYNVFYFKTLSMCIFNTVKKQSGIRFIFDALFGYFAYLHSLYTVVELHTNFVLIHFGRQPYYTFTVSRCNSCFFYLTAEVILIRVLSRVIHLSVSKLLVKQDSQL